MGVFVVKAKKANFRVFIEEWKPTRKIITVRPENYPTYNLNHLMSFEQAKAAAKEYNLKTNSQKRRDAKVTAQTQTNALLNSFALPEHLAIGFAEELRQEYRHNPDRLSTLEQHWKSAQLMLFHLKLDYTQFFDNRFKIFNYYEKKFWSADYIKRITKILNQWGSYCARQKRTYFEPIPKIGIHMQKIVQKREGKTNIRKPATPLSWIELKNLRTRFENENLTLQWNWLFIGLFFGLRPSEIDSLTEQNKYRIEHNNTLNVDVLYVYQNKLKNLAESRRWKVIPINEPEQVEALGFIKAGKLKRPLNKTLKRLFETKGIDTYSPRKAFTDLMLDRNYELEDISTFLGHTSIETTWRHYKNKLAFKLPKKIA